MSEALAVIGDHGETTALDYRRRVKDSIESITAVRTFVAEMMVEGVDFGSIPGTDKKKKNLLLPGAQKANMYFNCRPEYRVERVELGEGHVEYIVHTNLVSRTNNEIVGAGVGSCSTMEGKYRFRDAEGELTGEPVPKAYWDKRKVDPKAAQALIGGPDFKTVKTDDGWMIARKSGEKVENPNIYDLRNTVLKMAKKRSLVDASVGLACLSEFFTQDMESVETFDLSEEAVAAPNSRPAAAPDPAPASATKKSAPPKVKVDPKDYPEGHELSGIYSIAKIIPPHGAVKVFAFDTTEGFHIGVWHDTQKDILSKAFDAKQPVAITFSSKKSAQGRVYWNLVRVERVRPTEDEPIEGELFDPHDHPRLGYIADGDGRDE